MIKLSNPINAIPFFVLFALAAMFLPPGGFAADGAHLHDGNERARLDLGDAERTEHKIIAPQDITFSDGPDALPRGARYAVLEGDPSREGPFTMRLKLPADYRIPPHTHPKVERVTVLSGTFHLGMGRQEIDNEQIVSLGAGSFFLMPPEMEHFARTTEETIVQLTSVGPWEINYINELDDPRRQQR